MTIARIGVAVAVGHCEDPTCKALHFEIVCEDLSLTLVRFDAAEWKAIDEQAKSTLYRIATLKEDQK